MELSNSGIAQFLLKPLNIVRTKLDPRSAKSVFVVERVSRIFLGCGFRELYAEAATIAEGNEKHRLRQPKVPLDDVTSEHIPKN